MQPHQQPYTAQRVFLFLSCHVSWLQAVALVGEFNNWDPQAEHWASRNNFGVWQLFLPDTAEGDSAIPHRCTPTANAAKPPRRRVAGGEYGWFCGAKLLFGEE